MRVVTVPARKPAPRPPSVLLADNRHVTKRNHLSLVSLFERSGARLIALPEPPFRIDAFGQYDPADPRIEEHVGTLRQLDADALFDLSVDGINLFDCARAELFSLLAARPGIRGLSFGTTRRDAFQLALRAAPDALLVHLAVVRIWWAHWRTVLHQHRNPSYAIVFSGSLIYARTFIEAMKTHPGRLFVTESLFTGQHFYLEERYAPLANGSDLRHDTVHRALLASSGHAKRSEAQRAERNRRLLLEAQQWKSKNAPPLPPQARRVFASGPVLLILGQVANDFSLLETGEAGINAIHFYLVLIRVILDRTDLNIVFKAHPWERRKTDLKAPLTATVLGQRFAGEPRLRIVEEASLDDLFAEADVALTLSSQAGIQAALAGLKPIQAGRAFWGRRGFSHDIRAQDRAALLRILSQPDTWSLKPSEYDSLTDWLSLMLDHWVVREDDLEAPRLRQLLHEFDWEGLASR